MEMVRQRRTIFLLGDYLSVIKEINLEIFRVNFLLAKS